MRQHPKYQMICDYTPIIFHDMSITHDMKRCETPMQKLQEIIFAKAENSATKATIWSLESLFSKDLFCYFCYRVNAHVREIAKRIRGCTVISTRKNVYKTSEIAYFRGFSFIARCRAVKSGEFSLLIHL